VKRPLRIINDVVVKARRHPLFILGAFFTKSLFYYLAFLFLWTGFGDWNGVSDSYADTYRAVGTTIFRKFPPHGTVVIRAKIPPTPLLDSELRLGNDETKAVVTQAFSARYHGYAPIRLMLSLILASPFSWQRRFWAAVSGLLLIHAWILFELCLMIFDGYTGDHEAAMYTFRPSINATVAFITHVAADTIVPRYFVPCVAWILVTFRRGDWENFRKTSQARETG